MNNLEDQAGKMSGRNRASVCLKNKLMLGADHITPLLVVGGKKGEKNKSLEEEQMKKKEE